MNTLKIKTESLPEETIKMADGKTIVCTPSTFSMADEVFDGKPSEFLIGKTIVDVLNNLQDNNGNKIQVLIFSDDTGLAVGLSDFKAE